MAQDDYDDEDRPRRRRRPRDDDDYDDRRRPSELGWLDQQFRNTPVVLLVLFGFCCGVIALAFGIAGLAACTDPKARRNAQMVVIISAIMTVLGVAIQVIRLMAHAQPQLLR